ncbi:MAG: hypothetical protein ABR518_08910 [Actinomycetota bacterium]
MFSNLLNPVGWILAIGGWLQRRKARRATDTLVPPHVRDLGDGSVEPNLPPSPRRSKAERAADSVARFRDAVRSGELED